MKANKRELALNPRRVLWWIVAVLKPGPGLPLNYKRSIIILLR